MTVLKFSGVVTFDAPGKDRSADPDVPFIGGFNVIGEVNKVAWKGAVTVAIGDERFTGDLEAWEGMRGWSEYTPGEPAELFVKSDDAPPPERKWMSRGHNIMDILWRHEAEPVTMWVADEPINTLE